ncbi:G patch domain-containing protein 4 [Nowakowskiella sp. JEL0407]|nr:G patch domain-containing protein 4 [Nowakowskiella sp. JEL0407]
MPSDWTPSFGGLAVAETTGSIISTGSSKFAVNQLEKYGWKKGDGLGKKKDGINKAISVGLKNDNKGLGSGADEWGYQWWDHVFNKSSACITVDKDESGEVKISGKSKKEEEKIKKTMLYSGFVTSRKEDEEEKDYSIKVTDEELLAACEGRTARKGARADVQTGKLKRTGHHQLLKHVEENEPLAKSEEKPKKRRNPVDESVDLEVEESQKKKKKKKKDKETVSENQEDEKVKDDEKVKKDKKKSKKGKEEKS